MMRVGIGIHHRQGRQSPDFLLTLQKAMDAACLAFPQLEFDMVADAPDFAALQAVLFDGSRQAVFLIADTGWLHFRCIREILALYLDRGERVLIEAKAVPVESPRRYDPQTLQTEWCSKDRLFVPQAVYEELGPFDPGLEGLFDDVDYSWRARSAGIATLIHPGAWFGCSPVMAELPEERQEALRLGRQRLLDKWPGRKQDEPYWFAETRWDADSYWLAGLRW